MKGKRRRVVVLGGGVSGLCAAWHLARDGAEVVVVEKKPVLGGRAGSFRDETTGDILDTGPHLFLGVYGATKKWFEELGVLDKVPFQGRLNVPILYPGGGRSVYGGSPYPAPFGFIISLLPMCSTRMEKLSVFRLLRVFGPLRMPLDDMSAAMWLDSLKIPQPIRRYVLEPVAAGYLNQSLSRASAYPFARLLRKIMMSGTRHQGLGLAKVSLEELYVRPVEEYLARHDGRIITGVAVTGLRVDERGKAMGVALGDGSVLEADAVISSLQPWDFQRALGTYSGLASFSSTLGSLAPTAAVTVYLWLDHVILKDAFAGLPESPFDWVFDFGNLVGKRDTGAQLACLTMVAAEAFKGKTPQELVTIALEDLKKACGYPGPVSVVHSRVLWEPEACVSLEPGSERVRRMAANPVPGLYLAGDWVEPGSTISFENAVASGILAARRALAAISG